MVHVPAIANPTIGKRCEVAGQPNRTRTGFQSSLKYLVAPPPAPAGETGYLGSDSVYYLFSRNFDGQQFRFETLAGRAHFPEYREKFRIVVQRSFRFRKCDERWQFPVKMDLSIFLGCKRLLEDAQRGRQIKAFCNALDSFHALKEAIQVAVDIDNDYVEYGSVLVSRLRKRRQTQAQCGDAGE
jgi:hypothetical protein